jgi:hypothetical protein
LGAGHYSDPGELYPVATVVTTEGAFSSLGGWNPNFLAIGAQNIAPRLRIFVRAPPAIVQTIPSLDPADLKVTADGSLYILSRSNQKLLQFDKDLNQVRSLTGSPIGTDPTGLDVDNQGRVYIAMNGQHEVIRLVPNAGTWVLDITFGTSGKIGGLGTGDGQFTGPWDVGVVGNEFLSVTDAGNNRIQVFALEEGDFVRTEGQLGTGAGDLDQPLGIAVVNDLLLIADSGNDRISQMRIDGNLEVRVGKAGSGPGEFQNPVNLDFGLERYYVVDQGNSRVQIFDAGVGGSLFDDFRDVPLGTAEFPSPILNPTAAVAREDGASQQLVVADAGSGNVILVDFSLDSPLSIWEAFKEALRLGDVEGAVAFIASPAQNRYRGLFLVWGANRMKDAADNMPSLEQVTLTKSRGEFRLLKEIQGVDISFPVFFVRESGEWRIASF